MSRPEAGITCPPLLLSTKLFFLRQGLCLKQKYPFRLTGWPMSYRNLFVSTPSAGITDTGHFAWLLHE